MLVSIIFCSEEGCDSSIQTEEVAPGIRYKCRKHTPSSEQTVFFQEHAFDRELDRSCSPSGTEDDQYQIPEANE